MKDGLKRPTTDEKEVDGTEMDTVDFLHYEMRVLNCCSRASSGASSRL